MAEIIKMPKMSDTMTEGVIAAWHKKVGDKVKSGDVLAEVETDKATMDLESYETGVLLHIGVEAGSAAKVDGIIAIIGKEGEDISGLLNGESKPAAPAQAANAEPAKTEEAPKEAAAPAQPQQPAADTSNIPATVIRMPKMSDTMTEGQIVAWNKKVGDKVKSGEVLAEVETDKATMDLESYDNGTLLYIGIEAGNAAKVDDIIAIIGKEGTDYKPLLNGKPSAPAAATQSAPVEEKKTEAPAETQSQPAATAAPVVNANGDGRIKASPLAKNIAKDKGLDLSQVTGSGENGRVTKKDVDNFKAPEAKAETAKASVGSPAAVGVESFDELPVSQMRKAIARSLADSLFTAPHFYLTMEIDMDRAIEARNSMNEVAPVKISFNDLVVKASATALRKHPMINASWRGDKIRVNHHVHIGIAVAVEDGLLVPVVRFADNKSLSQISAEVKELGGKAKSKKLQPSDWEGNTFTISNLGMFGIDEFTSILNSPEACILSVGGIKAVPVVKNGQVVPGNIMKVTLACDHRVVDGATGAAFLQTLKGLIENPVRILI